MIKIITISNVRITHNFKFTYKLKYQLYYFALFDHFIISNIYLRLVYPHNIGTVKNPINNFIIAFKYDSTSCKFHFDLQHRT